MKNFEEIKKILMEHEEELKSKFKVKELGIFGSYARNEQREDYVRVNQLYLQKNNLYFFLNLFKIFIHSDYFQIALFGNSILIQIIKV